MITAEELELLERATKLTERYGRALIDIGDAINSTDQWLTRALRIRRILASLDQDTP